MKFANHLMPGEHNYQMGLPMPGQMPQQPPRQASALSPAPQASAPQPRRSPVMNALSAVFEFGAPEAFEQGRQKKINRELGNMLAEGDVAGAGKYAYQMGNLEQGGVYSTQAAESEAAIRKQQAQGIVSLFGSMQPEQVSQFATQDPQEFERLTGMTSQEYLQAAGRFGDGGAQFSQYAVAKAQAELGQVPKPTEYGFTNVDGVGLVRTDPQKGTAETAVAASPGYETITLKDGEYEFIPGQPESLRKLGDSPVKSPLVDIRLPGEGPQETAFMKKAGELEASNFAEIVTMGQTARRNRVTLDQLDIAAASTPGGMEAVIKNELGNYGIQTEGLTDIQATEALINQLVPAQRPPGSGPMSDRDLALFKASLPRLVQTPQGREQIINNIKAINNYVLQEGEIASQVLSGQITPEDGRARMQALGNPLAGKTQSTRLKFNAQTGEFE